MPTDPMLAIGSTGSSGRAPYTVEGVMGTGDWVLDLKLDGERAIVHDGRIFNRKGADVTHLWPEVVLPKVGTYDGEVLTQDGKFESTLLRSSQAAPHAIKRLAESHPALFIAFDLPGLSKQPWTARRATLQQLQVDGLVGHITPITYDDALWERTRRAGMEGVIAKRLASQYRPGKRSTDWIKFKHLHRVTCVAVGYEPGNGHRERFGAMKLAMVDANGAATPVGRVGSGFTDRQIDALKALLDDGKMPVVEIECTHVTSGGTLRFPVYRGQRLDVALTDCTTDQLDTIPRTG